jgi:adenylate cyclase
MQSNRQTTVLFAEVNSIASRYEAARNAITSAVINVADSSGGLVMKSVGDKVMVLFATPSAAASAASRMHAIVDALPAVSDSKPGVHIGFHTGPAKDSIDKTVTLALRLAEQAQDGQTITSQETAKQLNPAFRDFSRPVHLMQGSAEKVWLYEVASWHQKGLRPQGWSAMAALRLTYRDQLAACSREKDSIIVGREDSCDLVINTKLASRTHCTIRHRDGTFMLRDHSKNGTYLTTLDNIELSLRHDETPLPDEGRISIGESHADPAYTVAFCFALVT